MKPLQRRYQDPTRRDWVIGIITLVIFVIAIALSAILLLPDYWLLWLILVVAGVGLLTLSQTRNFACRCRECECEFEITFIKNLLAPHGVDTEGSWQWLQCPNCEKRVKVTVIKILK
jgi:hypothetical protein